MTMIDYEIELYTSIRDFLIASKNKTVIDQNYIDVDKTVESLNVKIKELEEWRTYVRRSINL